MDKYYISARLSQLRMQKGYSARDMSISLGQSECYINKIENRKIIPTWGSLFNICEYLNISMKDFFDDKNNYPRQINEVCENLQKLDSQTLHYISEIIKQLAGKN